MATPESTDHNETFDYLTINKAIIDAAGVEHDAELADLADTDGSSGGGFSVSDDDASVLTGPGDLNFGSFLTVSDDGDGSVTIDAENTNTDTHITLENTNGTSLLKNPDAVHAGYGLSVTDDGDNTATLDYDGVATEQVANGVVTLSGGSASVSTGITSAGTELSIHLDPSGGGANSSTVKVAARAVWTGSEYEVEILEDGTSVGNPDVGYTITQVV